MKKIDTSKSVIFGRKMDDLKASFEYLNKEGYFSSCKDFSHYEEDVLNVVKVSDVSFYPYEIRYDGRCFGYFIPKSKVVFVEEKPKKYRPFENVYEFETQTGCNVLGESVMRLRSTIDNTTHTLIYTGYGEQPNGVYYIYLGGYKLSLQELFEEYVLVRGDKTFILGVEE